MRSSRALLLFTAMLAVAAWTNVQVMACCWLLHPVTTSASQSVAPSEAQTDSPNGAHEDHSCCPRENPTAASTTPDSPAPMPGCDMGMEGAHSTACFKATPPAEHLVSASGTFFQYLIPIAIAFVDSEPESGLRVVDYLASISEFSSPPRYLSLQHFLI